MLASNEYGTHQDSIVELCFGMRNLQYYLEARKRYSIEGYNFSLEVVVSEEQANDGGRMLNADEIHNSVNYFQMEFEKQSVSENKTI